jgi:hypothetical protein
MPSIILATASKASIKNSSSRIFPKIDSKAA